MKTKRRNKFVQPKPLKKRFFNPNSFRFRTKLIRALLVSFAVLLGFKIYFLLEYNNFTNAYLSSELPSMTNDMYVTSSVLNSEISILSIIAFLFAATIAYLLFRYVKIAYSLAFSLSKKFQHVFTQPNGISHIILRPFTVISTITKAMILPHKSYHRYSDKFFFFSLKYISLFYFILTCINRFLIRIDASRLENATTALYYLIYTNLVGIGATILWLITVTRLSNDIRGYAKYIAKHNK